VERVFLRAWSRAQEGEAGGGRDRVLSRWLPKVTAPLGRPANLLLAKEVTVFLREPGAVVAARRPARAGGRLRLQLLGPPAGRRSPLAAAMREMAALLNLGLAAFVTTSVAVRFVYPAPSLEGRSWWVLRTAPIPLAAIWRSKFTIGFVPLAVLAEVLVAVTNRFLGVPSGLTIVFMATLLLVVAAIVSLGIAFGAAHPRFDAVNPAQIATSFGAVLYMMLCLALIALVVAVEAWPVSRLFWHGVAPRPLGGVESALVGAAFGAVTLVTSAAFVAGRRAGLRYLAALEP